MDIRGWTALISGASSGIGAEFARQLHLLGVNLLLVARREDRLRDLCRSFNAQRAESAGYIRADLTDFQKDSANGLQALLERLKGRRIDLLVNNAGCGSFGYFEELPIEGEVRMVDLNISATLKLAHALISAMKARRSGWIISVSSLAAFQPLPYMATYAATKAFNYFHSMALRRELKRSGVRVTTVCPGPTATEFGGVARVPGTAAGAARDAVEMVVRGAIAAFLADRPFVFTGRRTRLLSLLVRCLPAEFSCWLVWRMLKPALENVTFPRGGD